MTIFLSSIDIERASQNFFFFPTKNYFSIQNFDFFCFRQNFRRHPFSLKLLFEFPFFFFFHFFFLWLKIDFLENAQKLVIQGVCLLKGAHNKSGKVGKGCCTAVEHKPRVVVSSSPARCWAFFSFYPLSNASSNRSPSWRCRITYFPYKKSFIWIVWAIKN